MDSKVCKKCGSQKSLDKFSVKTNDRGYKFVRGICKSCVAENARLFRMENGEKVRAKDRMYRASCSDDIKEIRNKKTKEWREKNPEKVVSYRKKDRSEHSRKHYEKHKEKIKIKVSKYRKNNPEKIRALNNGRRTLERVGKLSPDIITRLYKIQKGLCVCCKKKLGLVFHLDHIVPLSLGGTNTDDNVQLLRVRCNLQKSAKHPVDFMQERGFLL